MANKGKKNSCHVNWVQWILCLLNVNHGPGYYQLKKKKKTMGLLAS